MSVTNAVRKLWRLGQRPNSALLLLALLLAVVMGGSLFPQTAGDPTPEGAARGAELQSALASRYGPSLSRILWALGAFRVGRSPLYLLIVGCLTAASLSCTLARTPALWRRRQAQIPPIADWYERSAWRATRGTAQQDIWPQLVAALKKQGFSPQVVVDTDQTWLGAVRNGWAVVGTCATHYGLVLLVLGGLLTAMGGWREEIPLPPNSSAAPLRLPELLLSQQAFDVTKDAAGNPLAYAVTVSSTWRGQERQHVLRINHPLRVGPAQVYLSSYWPTGQDYAVVLLVGHDPGWPLVLLGGVLLTLGVLATFYFPVTYVVGCYTKGRLRLALSSRSLPAAAQARITQLCAELGLAPPDPEAHP